MPLLNITATPQGLCVAGPASFHGIGPSAGIAQALAQLPDGAPVVVLVHGRGYAPAVPRHNPHELLFAPRSPHGSRRFTSWPRRLGFALPLNHRHAGTRGLCIGFGWEGRGDIWSATRRADAAGAMLARLVQMVRRAAPHRAVDLIGHSLGARVILSSVPLLAPGALGRVFLLAGADLATRAQNALSTPAGAEAEFFNITSRENDLFDMMFELALAPMGGAALGRGTVDAANWLDIQIDHSETLERLRGMGFPLLAPRLRVCHWSVYLRPGVFRLYRALLHDRERMALPQLRDQLAIPPEPRWSRLRAFAPLRGLAMTGHRPGLEG